MFDERNDLLADLAILVLEGESDEAYSARTTLCLTKESTYVEAGLALLKMLTPMSNERKEN